jgi:hypothetical protein
MIRTILFSWAVLASINLTQAQTCPNQGIAASQDFDCDGIINSIDLDDDNDGILDSSECGTTPTAQNATVNIVYSLKNGTSTGAYTTGKTTGYATTAQNFTTPGLLSFTARAPDDAKPATSQTFPPGGSYGTISQAYIKVTPAANEFISSFSIDATASLVDDGYHFEINDVIVASFNATNWQPSPNFSGATALFDTNRDGLWRPWTNEGTPELKVDLVSGTVSLMVTDRNGVRRNALPYIPTGTFNPVPLVNITQGVKIGTAWSDANGIGPIRGQTIVFNAQIRTYCDTDQDGLTDNLDNDSDADGCSDAIEGGASFTAANTDINNQLTGGVNVNGVPLVAGTAGQTIDKSTKATRININNPLDVSCTIGTTANFSATVTADATTTYASGSPIYGTLGNANVGLTYQWQRSTDNRATWSNVVGQTASSLSIPNTILTMNGYDYRVIIGHSDYACSITPSNAAKLWVGNCGPTTEVLIKN